MSGKAQRLKRSLDLAPPLGEGMASRVATGYSGFRPCFLALGYTENLIGHRAASGRLACPI